VLALDSASNPRGVTFNMKVGQFYWVDDGQDKVMKAHMDGTYVETIADGLTDPFAVAVDELAEKLYWT